MFHSVGINHDGWIWKHLSEPTYVFENFLRQLRKSGYTTVTLDQLFAHMEGSRVCDAKSIALVFDDGYLDNYQVAAPLLEQLDFPATFYVLTGSIGTQGYMTWDQVVELDRLGMDIGSHAINHRDRTVIPVDEARREIADSAAELYNRLGHPVFWFCYPSGKINADVVSLVQQSGYLLAASTIPRCIRNSSRRAMISPRITRRASSAARCAES